MSKPQTYRDYNIINFSSVNPMTGRAGQQRLEPLIPRKFSALTTSRNESHIQLFLSKTPTEPTFMGIIDENGPKKPFDPSLQSKITWHSAQEKREKKSLFNANSLDFDFISFAKKSPQTMNTLRAEDPKVGHKTNPVSEFTHLGRVTSPNFNPNFHVVLSRDPKSFRIKTGMGGHYCDGRKSYGEIANAWKKSGK